MGIAAVSSVHAPASAEDAKPIAYTEIGLCNEFERSEDGTELGAFASGVKYSEHKDNDVAVLVNTGGDIPRELALQVADKFQKELIADGHKAKCFRGGHDPNRNTGFLFLVNGYLVPEGLTRWLTGQDAIKELDSVSLEATLVRKAGIKGDPRYLLSAAPDARTPD